MRQLVDADWPAFCAFAEKYFGMAHNRDRKFNEHWFKTLRHDGWAAMVIDRADGSIGGIMMLIVTSAWFGGRELPMAWISTGVVEPELRARGAGAQLFMWAYRSFPLIGALSGNGFSNPMNNTLGKTIPGVAIRRFLYIHDARTLDLCRADVREPLRRIPFTLPAVSPKFIYRWLEDFPEDYDALWTRARKETYWTTARTPQYRKWRFLDAPHVAYRVLEIRVQETLRAVAVIRFQTTPAGIVARIVDFIAEGRHAPEAWRTIVRAVSTEGVICMDFFVIGSSQDAALVAAGFRLVEDSSVLSEVPHLLSPVEHRKWSNTVHFGGRATGETDGWRSAAAIYFNKSDSDRDWPTPYDLDQRTIHGSAAE